MIILKYSANLHRQIIHAAVLALKQGKIVAYPTDTSYGLAADALNPNAIPKLYKIKERQAKKPVHIVVPSITYAKKIAKWGKMSSSLAKKFWPGALTIILECRIMNAEFRLLTAQTGYIGLRMPDNKIAFDLSKELKRPITATSANPSGHISGGYDSYSAQDIVNQFKNKKYKPDIIIDAGKLPKRKPSTLVKIDDKEIKILRKGPVSEKAIRQVLRIK